MNSASFVLLRLSCSEAVGGLLTDPRAAVQHYCFLYSQRQIAVIIQKEPEKSDKRGRYRGGAGSKNRSLSSKEFRLAFRYFL